MKTGKSWDLEVCTLTERGAWQAAVQIVTKSQTEQEGISSLSTRLRRKPGGQVQPGRYSAVYRERAGAQLAHSIRRCYTHRTWGSWELRPLSVLLNYLSRLQTLFSTLTPGLSWWSIALITSLSFKNTFSPIPRPTILISNAINLFGLLRLYF